MSLEDSFVKQKFHEYYAENAKRIAFPPALESREFGAGNETKIDYRHKSFSGENELREFLSREAPYYISYSTARYSLPAARPMEKKLFLGADLAFDLDKPSALPPHEHGDVLCEYCLDKTREDAMLFLEEFLLTDFGFSENEVQTNFSGGKGFHFHVRSPEVQNFSSTARKELCDYAAALGVTAETLFGEQKFGARKANYLLAGPSKDSGGWKFKAFNFVLDFAKHVEEKTLRELGIGPKRAREFVEKRELILEKISAGIWNFPEGYEEVWKKLSEEAVRQKRVELDAPVSFDLARLIRLPGSLHGDTGLVTKTLSRKELAGFRPLRHAVVFNKGVAEVVCDKNLKISFLGQEFEFAAGVKKEVPEGLAVLLLRKGAARLG